MFRNDYSVCAAPEIMAALQNLCAEENTAYGEDKHSARAKELIKDYFGTPDADVHFIAGGTQTNMTVISYFLRPYEGVIACDTAHINTHETAAVEGSGHKIYACPNRDGKLTAQEAERAFLLHADEHMMKPAMVYISQASETGTLYTKAELTALRQVCDRYGLMLFLDGARLAVALACGGTDADEKFIGSVCDIFYAGGTKNGLLFGEAVVIKDSKRAEYFRYHIKNRGAMLAKGFVLGAQFEALFTDGLYVRLARNTCRTADIIRNGLEKRGVTFVGGSKTNQIFIRLPAAKAQAVCDKYGCEKWTDLGNEWVIRIVTSFATTDTDCEEFLGFFD